MCRMAHRRWMTVMASAVAVTVLAVNGYLLFDLIQHEPPGNRTWLYIATSVFIPLYYTTALYFAVGPENMPAICGYVKQGVSRGTERVRKLFMGGRPRWADAESMLEGF